MTLYHIEKAKYRNVWPPEGTLHAEGRWNSPGQWIIYASPSIALAKLETLANSNILPIARVCMTIEVTENSEIFQVNREDLPQNWMTKPYSQELRRFTEEFLKSGNLLFQVPSAQSHREVNFLINVRHSSFYQNARLVSTEDEFFDPRLKS